jgi:phosphatidylglycerol:prolipoprotein diacylglycerol transferase
MIPYFVYGQINLGPLTIYTWGLFLGLAFLVSYWLVQKTAKTQGIAQKNIFWLAIFIFLGSLLGARLGYILQFPSYYFSHPLEIFQVWAGGMMFYGGLFGALFLGWFYIKKSKLNFREIADLIAPAVALAILIGRLGCSLINDHQGAVTSLPWGILWPDGTIRHPVAEYLAINALIMFLFLRFLGSRVLKRPGQLFILFLFWYSLSRFFLDFARAMDTPLADPHYWGLFISQWISLWILFILTGILFYVRIKSKINSRAAL